MLRPDRRAVGPGERRLLGVKIAFFFAAAALWLAALATGLRWLSATAIVLLLAGMLVTAARRRTGGD